MIRVLLLLLLLLAWPAHAQFDAAMLHAFAGGGGCSNSLNFSQSCNVIYEALIQ